MNELAFTRKKIPGFKTLAEEDKARIDAAKAKGPMTNADIAAEMRQSRSQPQQPYNPSAPKDFKVPDATPAVVPEAPAVVPEAIAPVAPEATPPVAPKATPAVVPDVAPEPAFDPVTGRTPEDFSASDTTQSSGASAPSSDRKRMDLSGIASFLGDAGGNVMKALTSPEARGIVGALGNVAGLYGQSRSAAAGQTETNPIFLQKQREFELAKQAKELENQRTLLGTQTETQKLLQTQALGLQKYLGELGFDQTIISKVLEGLNAVNTVQTQQKGEYGTGPNTKYDYQKNLYTPGGPQSQANERALEQSYALQTQGIRNLLRFAPQLMSQIGGGAGGSGSFQDSLTAAAKGIGQNPGSMWSLNIPDLNNLGQQAFSNNLSLFNTARGMMPPGGGNAPLQ
jgi:hypothetical protein